MPSVIRDSLIRALEPFALKVYAILILLAVVTDPFGMYTVESAWVRFLFWLLVVTVSGVMGNVASGVSDAACGEHRPICSDLMMTGLMTLAFTPVLLLLVNGMVIPEGQPAFSLLEGASYVLAINVVVCLFRRLMPGLTRYSYFRPAGTPDSPRLQRRLPEDFEGPILRLTVRDHFVEVISARSSCSLRLRFADAVEEMEPVEGFCTHRSHWVSREAVLGTERHKGRYYLRLTNDDLVPVSRTYRPELEDAGLLDPQEATA